MEKKALEQQIYDLLLALYGEGNAEGIYQRVLSLLSKYEPILSDRGFEHKLHRVDEQDVILITYGDVLTEDGKSGLESLRDFMKQHLSGKVSTVHILPFYPYSSDDGFSVIDYREVDPRHGSWEDVDALGCHFRVMVDAVVNHISAQSRWFERFKAGQPAYQDFFIKVEPGTDLSMVFRPRARPLLSPVETADGAKYVWTTFSPDQIDLNFQNPDVLIEIMDTMLFYVQHGAGLIRLDAVAFLWKEIGTTCIHLPQTHQIIQLMRTVLDVVAPQVMLITETNVPHEENISYFGDGGNEAQMVYNFSLPPLLLHTFHTGKVCALAQWAKTLDLPSDQTTFFNFTASHDGVGLMPVKDLLSEAEVQSIADRAQANGGFVSYKSNPDGTESPYELNINYFDALCEPGVEEDLDLAAWRFLASQSIMLALRGVPGVYYHSLLGSRNWREGVKQTGRARSINRQKLNRAVVEKELADQDTLRSKVFSGYCRMFEVRKSISAFHPMGGQEVLDCGEAVFGLHRFSLDRVSHVICLTNVTSAKQEISLDAPEGILRLRDRFSDRHYDVSGEKLQIELESYGVAWLEKDGG